MTSAWTPHVIFWRHAATPQAPLSVHAMLAIWDMDLPVKVK